MNIRQYIYEFFGFVIFYSIAGLIFGFEFTIISVISGIIGAFIGKFISKVNGFFFEKIVNYNQVPLKSDTGELNVHFEILAKYKGNQISIWACYTSKNIIDLETLNVLLYNKITSSHYKKIVEQGFVTVEIKLKSEPIELLLTNN
ncbi:hypothetical protein [Daejeonella sp.]|uniref:hypothetical protein n=1 Tax=Daejeonella sp. TaxID=2805397 RepID=UPI0025B8DA04|nr:hypothetical protein [Daejeonella sp.]